MKHMIATRSVPAILVRGGFLDIPAGTIVEVTRTWWRNGEGWVRLSDGREAPDVFFDETPPCPPECTNVFYGRCPRCFDQTGIGCPHGDPCDSCREEMAT